MRVPAAFWCENRESVWMGGRTWGAARGEGAPTCRASSKCGCQVLGCAKSSIVHRSMARKCGCRVVACAKSPRVHGFFTARRKMARTNPYTIALLVHRSGGHPHLTDIHPCTFGDLAPPRAIHPHLTGPHPCTFGDLAHAGLRYPHGAFFVRRPSPHPAAPHVPLRPVHRSRRLPRCSCRILPHQGTTAMTGPCTGQPA